MKFNIAGGAGVGIQLAALWLYVRALGLDYLLGTALAVETAVLHNFAWHERWTWKDRAAAEPVWVRLWRFHAANGLVSIAGNVLLMRLFAGKFGMGLLTANVASIAVTNVANFLLAEFFVFRGPPPPRGGLAGLEGAPPGGGFREAGPRQSGPSAGAEGGPESGGAGPGPP